jgi:Cu(I)/Ag(I) efflux system membrane fusion protein
MKLVRRSTPTADPHEDPVHESPVHEAPAHEDQFQVTAEIRQRMGLIVETVELLDFRPSMRVAAQVIADERRAVSLSPKVEGWIKRLGVSVVGQPVRAGQVLFEIYSPELQQRQRDYIDLLTRRDALLAAKGGGMGGAVGNTAPDLMLASVARERFRSRTRLVAADVPEAVLNDLEKVRRVHDVVPVLAEHDGVVTGIGARQGAYVTPAQTVVSYADLSDPWAELSINPELLALIRRGDEVEMHSSVDAMVKASARIDTSLAVVDPVSRTARIRVPLPGAGKSFPPGTLLDARIHLSARKALTLAPDAIIHTGQGDFVIIAEAAGHFRQAPVHLGAESAERIEVVDGLSPGQQVVTNGQFLLSAEASLQASRQRLSSASHDHSVH